MEGIFGTPKCNAFNHIFQLPSTNRLGIVNFDEISE